MSTSSGLTAKLPGPGAFTFTTNSLHGLKVAATYGAGAARATKDKLASGASSLTSRVNLPSLHPAASVAAFGAVVGPIATSLWLHAAGFGIAGVKAASWAAATQSSIGLVPAGSWFATAQSMGATGVLASTATVGVLVVGGVVVAVGGYYAAPHVKSGMMRAYNASAPHIKNGVNTAYQSSMPYVTSGVKHACDASSFYMASVKNKYDVSSPSFIAAKL